jgi:L-lactate dehydrogenase
LIAGRLNVAIRNVHGYIVGEHGDSEIPLWSCGDISAIPLADFESPGHPRLTEADKEEIIGKVRSAAGEIIKAKGATNWAIGLATARILEAILRDENAILTVSRLVSDWNGISDVCLSLPCVVSRHGAGPPLPVPMDDDELAGLRNSAEVLKQSIHEVGL